MSERNVRLQIQVASELPTLEQQLLEIIRLEKQLLEATNQANLSARTGSIQQIEAINAVSAALEKQRTARKKADDEATEGTKAIQAQMTSLTNGVKSFTGMVASAFAISEIKAFGESIIEAKTKIDSVQISLTTMLGSKKEADELYAKIVNLAKTTPFSLSEIAEQAVKLKAYNIETADLIPTITALGNISAAVGKEKLPQLTLAYGQVANAGKLMLTELRQFNEAGVPLLSLVSAAYGKTSSEVQKMADAHQISFAMVRKALLDASEAGGKYEGLMAKLSTTVGGQISNLGDTFEVAKARIGDFFENQISGGTKTLNGLINALAGSNSAIQRTVNYVEAAAAGYTTWKVAMNAAGAQQLVVNAATKAGEVVMGTYNLLMISLKGSTEGYTRAQQESAVASRTMWSTLSANPIGAIVTVVGLVTTAYLAWKAATTEVTNQLGEQELKLKDEQAQLNALAESAMDELNTRKQRKEAIELLIQKFPQYFSGLNAEKTNNSQLKEILDKVNGSYQKRIDLARQAYNLDALAEKRKELFEFERNFFNDLPKDIGEKFNNDIVKFNEALNAGNATATKLKAQLNDFAPGGAEFFGGVAKNATEKFKTVEDSYSKTTKNIQQIEAESSKALVEAENTRWKNQQVNLDKGSKSYQAAEQAHLDNLAKLNGTYREKEITNLTTHEEKTKQVTLISANEKAALLKRENAKTLEEQLKALDAEQKAEEDSVTKRTVSKNISNAKLQALEEEAAEKLLAINEKFRKKRAVIEEQMEQERQSAFLVKSQETFDKIKVLEAQQAEALRMQAMLENAKTDEARLAAIKVYEDKYQNALKDSATEQLRIQAEASKEALENIAVETGKKGDVYRTAYTKWLADNLEYVKALTNQEITAAKETAQEIQKYEKEIQDAKKETAKTEEETLKIQKQSRKDFIDGMLDLVSQQDNILGQAAGIAKSVFDGIDALNLKAVSTAKAAVTAAQGHFDEVSKASDAATAKGQAAIAQANSDLSDARKKQAEAESLSLSGVLNLFNAAYQIASAVMNIVNGKLAESWQVISEGISKVRDAYKEMYEMVQQSSSEAYKKEMEAFDASVSEKLAKLNAYYQKEIEIATGQQKKDAQISYEQAVNALMDESLAERMAKIDAYYAREKSQAEGQDRIDAALLHAQKIADILGDSKHTQEDIINAIAELELNKSQQRDRLIIENAELEKKKAEEKYQAKVQYINLELEAFKAAKAEEVKEENAALAVRQEANKQFYSDKQLRLQEDDVYRKQLLDAGEAREVAALEDAKQRELQRAQESGASAEEVARIKIAFDKLITDKHAEYQDAQGNKEKEISLANQETKAQEADKKESLEVETANKIQAIMAEIAKQEAAAANDRLQANADYLRQLAMANNAQFEANKRMKIAELQAEIAVLEAQKGMFSNNGAINAAIGSIQGAISTISALHYDTGGIDITPVRSVFGWTNIVKVPTKQVDLGSVVPGTGGSGSGGGGTSPISGGPGSPINQATGEQIGLAYDENGNVIVLNYNRLGHSFSAFDENKNPITVAFATGVSYTTGKRYFNGSDYVDGAGYPDGRDTVPAMVNKGERIVPTVLNNLLGGKALSNEGLVDKVLAHDKLMQMFPDAVGLLTGSQGGSIMKLPDSMMTERTDLTKMLSEMQGFRKELRVFKPLTMQVDRSGLTIHEIGVQSKINYKNKFFTR